MKNSRKNKKWMHLIALAIFVGVVACSMFMSSAATGNPNSTSKDSEYFKLSGYFRY